MGLLDFLFGRRDPAMDWIPNPALKLEVDLTDASLGGVKLGDPIERLSGLGPPENKKPSAQSAYTWYSRGLEISAFEDGRLDSLWMCWADPALPRFRSFPGTFLWKGKEVPIRGGMTRAEVEKRFGEPYHADEDEDEDILRYEVGDVEWELEIDRKSGLRVFLLITPGLFADAKTREDYGITRPWPPQAGQGRPA
jgi:hypothetical protein